MRRDHASRIKSYDTHLLELNVQFAPSCTPGCSWLRGTVVERWSLTGELFLSCTRPVLQLTGERGDQLCG